MSQKNNSEWSPLFGKTAFKIAELVFNEPNKGFHIRMLQAETGLSTTAVKSSVENLRHHDIVSVEKSRLTTNVKANTESVAYTFYKTLFNLYKLQRYGFIERIRKILKPEAIVLFGSFAKGEDVEGSDVDILVVTPNKETKEMARIADMMEGELKRKVDIKVLPSLSRSESEFRNAVANGIVLYGYLKVAV